MEFVKKDIYSSNAINNISNCISWGTFLACGMTQSVVLVSQSEKNAKIIQQFDQHDDIVTCLSWLSDSMLISADDSANIIIWIINPSTGQLISSSKFSINSFTSAIVDIHGIQILNTIYIVCCSESNVQFLKFEDNVFHNIHMKKSNPSFALSVNILKLNRHLLISSGHDDGRVICCVFDIDNNSMSEDVVLAGHEDWITSLSSICIDSNTYLSSASQDCYIRVWKIMIKGDHEEKSQLDVQKLSLSKNTGLYVYLDGVLSGHENWVTNCRFCDRNGELLLMSSSMDKSIIIWKKENDENSQWIEEMRLGQVGGNGLGFIGGDIRKDGRMLMGFGYQGDMVMWSFDSESENWCTVINIGGHFDVVEDLAWEIEEGRYLITVSKDQTTRLHAPWIKEGEYLGWHEVGRPQIHGYDMTSVASISGTGFITGADEKIARVFGMNKQFAKYFKQISTSAFDENSLRDEVVSADALGLSNKCTASESDIDTLIMTDCPKEENVSGRTLWPEITKLYGHVYEVFRISCHPVKEIAATTCKALVPEFADVIIWDTRNWTILQRLPFHKSTIVRVQFNKVGDKLVTVSKDRQWALWKNASNSDTNFQMVCHSTKPNQHSKIIWDVDWTSDDRYFVTASRDKKVILWHSDNGEMVGKPLVFGDSVNAITSLPDIFEDYYVFAVGLENGKINIIQFTKSTVGWNVLLSFTAHHDWITRLRFHPAPKDNKYLLASCSKDRFVKIFEIAKINK